MGPAVRAVFRELLRRELEERYRGSLQRDGVVELVRADDGSWRVASVRE